MQKSLKLRDIMGFVKTVARKIIFPSMRALGVENLFLSRAQSNIVNLYFHGVVEKDSAYLNPRHITQQNFESLLSFLSKKFDIIPLTKAFEHLKNGTKPLRKSVTISFDDGFENNLKLALPSLEKFNAPGTFFISTSIYTNPEYILWADLVDLARLFSTTMDVEIGRYTFKKAGKFGLSSEQTASSAYDYIKGLPAKERDQVLEKLRERYAIDEKKHSIPEETWKMMTGDQVRELDMSPLAYIGSHGHLHYNLGKIDLESAQNDILLSKRELESLLNRNVDMLAFPDGSYSNEVLNFCKSIGIEQLLAVDYQNPTDRQIPGLLNRFSISNTTTVDSNVLRLSRDFDKYGFC